MPFTLIAVLLILSCSQQFGPSPPHSGHHQPNNLRASGSNEPSNQFMPTKGDGGSRILVQGSNSLQEATIYPPLSFNQYVSAFGSSPTHQRILPRGAGTSFQQIQYRTAVAENNRLLINQNNQNPNRKFNLKINEFIFLTQGEFLSLYGSRNLMPSTLSTQSRPPGHESNTYVDITHQCYSGDSQHQGMCGSCYAITSSDVVAMTYAKYVDGGDYHQLSAQQIVSESTYTYGCNGGTLNKTFHYIKLNGLHFNTKYPYENQHFSHAMQPEPMNPDLSKRSILSARPLQGCTSILNQLQNRPLVIGIPINFTTAFYGQGNLTLPNSQINHGVVLVGAFTNGAFYVKNSWGRDWGYSGYAYIDQAEHPSVCTYGYSVRVQNQGPGVSC